MRKQPKREKGKPLQNCAHHTKHSKMPKQATLSTITLKNHYHNVYPFEAIFQWLSNRYPQGHREFALVYEKYNSRDFSRYNYFNDWREFKKHVLGSRSIMDSAELPSSIHIGGFYKNTPHSSQETPLGKELVFDVDLTSYSDYRMCCTDQSVVCENCWPFAIVAMRILKFFMEEVFNFKQLLFVFSGSKGFHLWVLDEKAFYLSEEVRATIVSALDYKEVMNRLKFYASHPTYQQIHDSIAKPFYEREMKKILSDLYSYFYNGQDLQEKLNTIEKADFMTVMKYTWPRIDNQVSIKLNHLIKSPFSLHPSTGKVCWVLQPEIMENPIKHPELFKLEENVKVFCKKTGITTN